MYNSIFSRATYAFWADVGCWALLTILLFMVGWYPIAALSLLFALAYNGRNARTLYNGYRSRRAYEVQREREAQEENERWERENREEQEEERILNLVRAIREFDK